MEFRAVDRLKLDALSHHFKCSAVRVVFLLDNTALWGNEIDRKILIIMEMLHFCTTGPVSVAGTVPAKV